MKKILAVLAVLCPCFGLGQQQLRSFGVGDTLPPFLFSAVSATGKAHPLSLHGKLTILDFWATWCTSCLKKFPKMEAVQEQFGSAVQVILVNTASTGDKESTVMAFFQKRRGKNGQVFKLPTLVGDTTLGRLFPHKLIPHYVWIDSAGKVLAITGADEVSADNIAAFLAGKPLRLPLKQDVTDYNNTLPLLHEGNGGSLTNLLQSSSFTAYLPGLGSGTRFYKDSLVQKTTWLNASILSLYRAALGYSANRLVLVAPDSARFFRSLHPPQNWHNQLFCYELTVPVQTAPAAAKRVMHQDLDRFFGLSGRMEYRNTPCWIITRLQPGKQERTPQATKLPVQTLSAFVESLNSQPIGSVAGTVFLDESGLPPAYTIHIPIGISRDNLPALRTALERQGLSLQRATRFLEVFVLSQAQGETKPTDRSTTPKPRME